MTPEQHDMLIQRYFDQQASPQEALELSQLIESDPELRQLVREIAEQAVTMADFARERLNQAPQQHPPQSPPQLTAGFVGPRTTRWWIAAASILLAMGITTFVWVRGAARPVATIQSVSGAVSFVALGEGASQVMAAGTAIPAGTLRCEGTASSVELTFPDGSTVTVVGDSELVVPAGRKILTLHGGSLTASVRPQLPGQPMVIHTPTADVEVVGTEFTMTADRAQTRLLVDSGEVKFRRRVDGQTVNVEQGNKAVASLGAAQKMDSPTPAVAASFRQTFDQQPDATGSWRGEWLPADGATPGRMRAEEDIYERRADGSLRIAYIVSTSRKPESIAAVKPRSVLRVRLRAAQPHGVLALVGLRNPAGGWYGNFQTIIEASHGERDAEGWRTVDLPLSAMQGTRPQAPDEGRVFLIYLAAYSPEAKLEVAEVSILPPQQ